MGEQCRASGVGGLVTAIRPRQLHSGQDLSAALALRVVFQKWRAAGALRAPPLRSGRLGSVHPTWGPRRPPLRPKPPAAQRALAADLTDRPETPGPQDH